MKITTIIILSTFTLWLTWTSVAQKYGERTISSTLRNMAWDWNILPFCFGMLITHWFAPRQTLPSSLWGWGVGLPVMVLIVAWDIYWLASGRERAVVRWPFWYFLLGLPVGYLFWPQISLHSPL